MKSHIGGLLLLLATEVDFGSRAVNHAGNGFAVAEQFVRAGRRQDSLEFRPRLSAGGTDDCIFVEQFFNANQFVSR